MATEMRSAFRDYLSRVAQWRAKSRGTTATEMLLITLAPYHRNDWHNMTEMAGTMATELSTQLFDPESDHGITLEQIKQSSLYTDMLGSGQWSRPADAVDPVLARQMLSIADSTVRIEKVMTSERELELWVKFLKPVKSLGRKRM